MHYQPDDGFEIRKASDEEALSLHRWSAAYALLGLAAVAFSLILVFRNHYRSALLLGLIGWFCNGYSHRLHRQSHEAFDD